MSKKEKLELEIYRRLASASLKAKVADMLAIVKREAAQKQPKPETPSNK